MFSELYSQCGFVGLNNSFLVNRQSYRLETSLQNFMILKYKTQNSYRKNKSRICFKRCVDNVLYHYTGLLLLLLVKKVLIHTVFIPTMYIFKLNLSSLKKNKYDLKKYQQNKSGYFIQFKTLRIVYAFSGDLIRNSTCGKF